MSSVLLEWRQRLGWSQARASRELGMALTNYQRLERGKDWNTGRKVKVDKRTLLACAALERDICELMPRIDK